MNTRKFYAEDLMIVVAKLTVILDEIDKMLANAKDYSCYDRIGMRREAIKCAQALLKLALQS